MGFKEVSSLDADTVIALGGQDKKTKKANAKQIEGYYLGSRTVADKKKKDGKSYIHVFQTAEGNTGVWGKTDLDRKLLAVTPGTMTRATHTGFRETPNGDMYTYKVEVDSENTIDVSDLVKQAQSTDTSTEGGYEDSGEEYDNEEETAYEPEPMQSAQANAEKQRKVQDILSRKSK
jgi:hypothetical protein